LRVRIRVRLRMRVRVRVRVEIRVCIVVPYLALSRRVIDRTVTSSWVRVRIRSVLRLGLGFVLGLRPG
jgi:hypothetical protein